jgi:hypothetical protein
MSSALTNTLTSHDVGSDGGNREELADAISNIYPTETPFMSMIGSENCESTHPEWLKEDLEEGDVTNAKVQGFEFDYDAVDQPTRVGNYTQISSEEFIISKTQEANLKAGRKSEVARHIKRKGLKLKFTQEGILLSNQASVEGDNATPGKLGGFPAWLTTNAYRGTNGADGGFNTSTKVVDAANNGDQRAFTKTLLDNCIQSVYDAGGTPKTLMCSNYVRRVFSTFMADANVAAQRSYTKNGKAEVVGTVEIYHHDFGSIHVVPNRRMTKLGAGIARNAFLVDPGYVKYGKYRAMKQEKPAQTGDAHKRALVVEYSLKVKNEAAHGVIADLYGLTAAS